MSRPNSLQAILAREAASPPESEQAPQPTPSSPAPAPATRQRKPALPRPQPTAAPATPTSKTFHRPSREGRRFLGGHFSPDVVRQMKMLAVEEDTTTQALLEEALNLLFVKKGKGRIISV